MVSHSRTDRTRFGRSGQLHTTKICYRSVQADQAEGNRMINFQTQPHAAREGWHAWGLLVFRTKRYKRHFTNSLCWTFCATAYQATKTIMQKSLPNGHQVPTSQRRCNLYTAINNADETCHTFRRFIRLPSVFFPVI